MTPEPAADERLELVCYLHDGWKPLIRPASPKRDWMDATPESFAYRCLPLNIANAHGWEVLSSCAFEAVWNGGNGTDAIEIRLPQGADPITAPVSIFGHGVITFHIAGLFRTPPGWNLWVGGSPNQPKDGIAPLGGVVETDWSPFTFTMNWRFTRPHHPVRFAAGEAVCFLFPVQRNLLESFTTRFAPIADEPGLVSQFDAWSRAREAFQAKMRREPPKAPADKWQKHYYRGVDANERAHIDDHQTKLRLAPFDWNEDMGAAPVPSAAVCPVAHPPALPADPQVEALKAELARTRIELARRDWLLDVAEGHRHLAPPLVRIAKRPAVPRDEFLQRYYAAGRPVVMTGLAGSDAEPSALQPYLSETPDADPPAAWPGAPDAFTPLDQGLANALVVQSAGRRNLKIAPPSETWRLFGLQGGDLDDRERLARDFPLAARARVYDITLEPGEALFLPLGWWRQARALGACETLVFTGFPWPNNAAEAYPRG